MLQRAVLSFVSLFLLCMLSSAIAADGDQAYLVLYAKFKPGKAPEALKIIREHFFPVDKKIGRKSIPFDFSTGEWDHVVYFPYDTAKMDTVPGNAVWWKTFV